MYLQGKRIAMLVLLLSALTAGLLLADDDDDDDEHGGHERGGSVHMLAPVANQAWQTECAACHMLYHPGLLPARSWKAVMTGLDKHFGENASLDPETQKAITHFLVKNSADQAPNLRSSRIAMSIPQGAAPLRISETSYFLRKHDEIRASVFKRKAIGSAANCAACHPKAEAGDFREDYIRIPK
jgi:hypothetical protein